MDIRFAANNTHLENALTFAERDPHLRRLYQEKYIYHSPLIQEFPRDEPGILTLGGGRQVGKSTLLKQWMQDLLVTGVPPQAICFYSGELIGDNQSLFYLLQSQLKEMPSDSMKYLIIDEITDIQYWEKGIKYLADIGFFENTVVMLSGSDLVLMQDARKGFPGRRGKASKVDFHYYPLSFREFIGMKDSLPIMDSEEKIYSDSHMKLLYEEFHNYLIHGGFLTAINDFANHQSISPATLMVYSDWIRGDFAKRNKNEIFLREIMGSIHKHYLKQVSWDNLAKELSINHVQTISDYASLLQSMDALFVQAAIMEDKLKPAPKKRKKLMFCDSFIYHAIATWLYPCENPFEERIKTTLNDPRRYSELVEACVTTHFRRFYPTYYIKAEGEVDIAYVDKERFWPVEVKWTQQLRPADLKQIRKYNNSVIYAKTQAFLQLDNIPIIPLPIALLNIK